MVIRLVIFDPTHPRLDFDPTGDPTRVVTHPRLDLGSTGDPTRPDPIRPDPGPDHVHNNNLPLTSLPISTSHSKFKQQPTHPPTHNHHKQS